RCSEIPETKGKFQNWSMASNQPITIEVDRADAKNLKILLYKRFNKEANPLNRPGQYNFRFLPAEDMMRSGTSGKMKRAKALRKHQAVVKSLHLAKSDDVSALDEQVKINGKSITLREAVLTLNFPLNNTDEAADRLFHTVDLAPTGIDAHQNVTYFTAYNDRADLAEKVVGILPALMANLYDKAAAKKWFSPMSLDIIGTVEFGADDNGDWDGMWTTLEDTLMDDILDEDLGIDLKGMDMLEEEEREKTFLTTDDASVATFGDVLNERPTPPENQPTGETAQAGVNAATGNSGGDVL
ncbi:MAG: hypothetical protein SGARI_006456, partial [Bacillariaceae sp.]